MRSTHILLAAASTVLIGLAGISHAAPAANSPPSSSTTKTGNSDVPNSAAAPPASLRPQQQQRPFYCFGDAACEREMDRLGRPIADRAQKRDESEGPYINGVPGQGYGPGFGNTPVPVVPGK
jgi:hypothetical protein